MTSKSIDTHIAQLRRSNGLVLFDPALRPHESYRRRLWLHPELNEWVHRIGETRAEQRYFANVRALLRRFVTGEDFDDDDILKPLNEGYYGEWEIRITFTPQDRIFGAFLRPGEFVATNRLAREQLAKQGWVAALKRSKAIWERLFGQWPRLKGLARPDLLEDFDP